jgi:hypothetical protein
MAPAASVHAAIADDLDSQFSPRLTRCAEEEKRMLHDCLC